MTLPYFTLGWGFEFKSGVEGVREYGLVGDHDIFLASFGYGFWASNFLCDFSCSIGDVSFLVLSHDM